MIALGLLRRVHIGAISEAATAHRMRDGASICFVLADADDARAPRAACGQIQLSTPLVTNLGRENDVVLDTTKHDHSVWILNFHNGSG